MENTALPTPLLSGADAEAKRDELRQYFRNSQRQYESLFSLLTSDDAFYVKAEPLRHPLIFYYGHTATFFVNKLKLGKYLDERINEHFESMFAIGVDEMSWDDLNQAHYDWPAVAQVRDYRAKVVQLVEHLLDTMELQLPITQDSLAWVLLMGIEHERIHLETSSVIIRQLPLTMVRTHPDWPGCQDWGPAPENKLIPFQGGEIVLGKDEEDASYGWDNEYGRQHHKLKEFRASEYLVSNGEYLAFVEDGGYQNPDYWTEEGRGWLAFTGAQMPRFWRRDGDNWRQRNLTEEIPLPLNWPVEVNQLEAKAFCNWKSQKTERKLRLPTEAEWYLMRRELAGDSIAVGATPAWSEMPGNLALAFHASSCPVNRFRQGRLYDIVGNVWQWTETAIDGFPGFAVHPLYDDFSTPTFDGKHNLMKGGSWVSTGNEAIASSRYAFRRHFYQHAGFRYLESAQAPDEGLKVNVYETDESISQYLEFHYGREYFGVANFCVNGVTQALAELELKPNGKALDIGCSVGRASFELARHFAQVDAIDFSARFIQQAYALTEQGEKRYTIRTEGDLVEYRTVTLAALGYEQVKHKVHFAQGDACNLKPMFSGYDLVYASNLIDRLAQPQQFLGRIHERLNEGGYLVIASPYTWLEEYTPKANWLGGIKINGENFTSLDGLTEALIERFELVAVKEIPFVIRETKRKFQHSLSEMSIWRKREKR
ncbi:5-histidylcysteine sulfoxide synthase [Shewanella sedimentimangrovi]|uniref:5-histidylcysteine sulfoxide synthase n=1 Tax=Shewanella sedimentimangrovi TaxID=2814293 RepID=A0ABX7R1X8_9GAMM|nr:5-histidylcysteine sulfoxide synthase [Shewanella sedimentimangrovi]QSX37080.1 5-histidylcysteine sulfoxide synthase [Shewanella sedimentimangrovi]